MKLDDGIIVLKSFSKIPNLIHGFSTRSFGSMRHTDSSEKSNIKNFAKSLKINPSSIVKMNQVHSNTVAWVTEKDKGKTISETDGILTKQKGIFLSVITADCVPLLFFDKQKEYIGVAHAGWRGLYSEIPKEMIKQMIQEGSSPRDILVGIGPCIHECCYEVGEDLAKKFTDKFGKTVVQQRHGKVFLNLPVIVKKQLLKSGIQKVNIEAANICTADNLDKFYSYRKEGKNCGEFMGVIGL